MSKDPKHGSPAWTDAVPFRDVMAREQELLGSAHGNGEGLVGVAFSGGGIRSATFNLGVLQGLAEQGLLSRVDYLSTVSGGGYIGGWLQAKLYRRFFQLRVRALERKVGIASTALSGDPFASLPAIEEAARAGGMMSGPTPAKPPLAWERLQELEVALALKPPSHEEVLNSVQADLASAEGAQGRAERREDPAIQFLRNYSSYLTPKTGLFTADTWTVFAIYLRNLALNFAVLVLALGALLLLVRTLVELSGWLSDASFITAAVAACGAVGLLSAFLSLEETRGAPHPERRRFPHAFPSGVVIPAALGAYLGSTQLRFGDAVLSQWWLLSLVAVLYGVLWWVGFWIRSPIQEVGPRDHRLTKLGVVVFASLAALLTMMVFLGILKHLPTSGALPLAALRAFGPSLLLGLIVLMINLQIGLIGRGMSEYMREWASRLAALLMLVAAAMALLFGMVVFGPRIRFELDKLIHEWMHTLTFAWFATTAWGLLSARDTAKPNRLGKTMASAAPYVFAFGVLVLVSCIVHDLSTLLSPWIGANYVAWLPPRDLWLQSCPGDQAAKTLCSPITMLELLVLSAALGGMAALLSWRVGVNEFSMHALYRNRLVRCYLGAVRGNDRRADPFTGFDIEDDAVLIDQLCVGQQGEVLRPYPIVNATLNLVVGERLAWQFRRASSFVFTPHFSGYEPRVSDPAKQRHAETLSAHGYRPTSDYGGGISLGTAMAISGAAVSPNMGAATSPALAFLMTVFNVRLGWWLGNPRHRGTWGHSGPRFGLAHLFFELLGKASDSRRYVYLSDGGHFDNLGIYELVRRRCRYIIACDATEDERLEFLLLGNAIEKCRVDFEVDIEIDLRALKRDASTGYAKTRCAVGLIRYDRHEPAAGVGILLYLKNTLTGCEPADVLTYAQQNPAFPHEPTTDQWFSEEQFEAYRVLGHHAAVSTFQGVSSIAGHGVEAMFVALREGFQPPSPFTEGSFARHAAELMRLLELLRGSPELHFLDGQIFPEWSGLRGRGTESASSAQPPDNLWLPEDEAALRSACYFCAQVIQLMESVYLDLHLDETYEHPDNRGWINLFHRWSWSGMVRVTWAVVASTMGARFQTFCERRLRLTIGDADVCVKLADGDAARDSLPAKSDGLQLNFWEHTLLGELTQRGPRGDDQPAWRTFAAQIAVSKRPESGQAARVFFTVGFGILERLPDRQDNKDQKTPCYQLVYLRIQDHLRKAGLARRALRALLASDALRVLGISSTDLRGLSEPVSGAGKNALARLFSSVQAERGESSASYPARRGPAPSTASPHAK